MSGSGLQIACGRRLTTDWDELSDWYCKIAALRPLGPAPKFTISSPQGHPEQIRCEAPLEVDIAAGPEASGMLRLVRPRMDGLQCPAPAVAASSSSRDRPEEIDPDAPLRVDFAAKVAFPHGGLTAAGLRKEIRRGRLPFEMIAGKQYVTLNDIQRMREQCRVAEKVPDCGKDQRVGEAGRSWPRRSGSSKMEVAISPRDALQNRVTEALRQKPKRP